MAKMRKKRGKANCCLRPVLPLKILPYIYVVVKFHSLLIVFLVALSDTGFSQWSRIQLPGNTNIKKIVFTTESSGYAISDYGVLHSTDGGRTWDLLRLGMSAYIIDMAVLNDSVIWVAGGDFPNGFVARTRNGGKNWSIQRTPLKQICAIHLIDSTSGWAVGNDNSGHSIYHTVDGGISWSSQRDGDDYVRSVYFNSPTHGWVAGDNGQLYTTTDAGVHWIERDPKVVFHFHAINAVNDTTAYAVGAYQYGGCYRTTDGGLHWQEQDLPSLAHLQAVQFTSSLNGWIAGDRGTILHTTDGGKHWCQETTDTREDLSIIFCTETGLGFAAGKHGMLLKRVQ